MWSRTAFDMPNAWTLGGGVTATSDRFTSNDNLVRLPEYARVDAVISYYPGRYEIALNLKNAFDTRYYESASSNFQIYPGAPRNAVVTIRYAF